MSTHSAGSYRDGIKLGIRDAMRRDSTVLLLGEDIAEAGGVFKVTEGLFEEFGAERVTDTPISEMAFTGAAIGLALSGFKPIVELMFAEFAGVAYDMIVNQAAKYLYLSAGQMNVPIVVRTVGGGGLRFGAQHSQTTESWYMNTPGLKVVAPSNPQDAYGLMIAAVQDPNPVVYIEHKALYTVEGELETNDEAIPIGVARTARKGKDVTVVASLAMVPVALSAADRLSEAGIDAEVIDLRTLVPLDIETVVGSVRRTGRLVTLEEQPVFGGWGGEVAAQVVERILELLDAPPLRLGTASAPVGFSSKLEDGTIPKPKTVADAIERLVKSS